MSTFYWLYVCCLDHDVKCTNIKTQSPKMYLQHLRLTFGGCSSGERPQGSVRSVLEHVQSYEITHPRWLQPHRHRRSANQEVSQSVPLTPLLKTMN